MRLTLLALAAIGTGLWHLTAATAGLTITQERVGTIPVTVYRPAGGGKAPVVVVAHGFAGSQQLMQPYAVTLARNGYLAVTFDFPGHGRNPAPFVAQIADQEKRVGVLLGALESVTVVSRRRCRGPTAAWPCSGTRWPVTCSCAWPPPGGTRWRRAC